MYFYQCLYLIIIMMIAQFGLADRNYVVLNSLKEAACAPNLQAKDPDIMSRDLFRAITKPDHPATRKTLAAGANPNAVAVKASEKLESRSRRALNGINPDTFVDVQALIYVEDIEESEIVINSDLQLIGATALHVAVMTGNAHIVNLLLESKLTKTDIKNRSGLTAFSLLASQDHIDDVDRGLMVTFFIESGKLTESDITNLFKRAIAIENFSMVEALAKYAPESEVINNVRNNRFSVPDYIQHQLDRFNFLGREDRYQEREDYRLAFRYLSERGLL